MNTEALKDLLYKMADDQLILGHRNSEWTGIGPMLEEDIAFSSMAQDKVGHSLALYRILEELGESDPDSVAFTRNVQQFHNCQLVELPIGEYDFSLVRHFLFDHAELLRFQMLSHSSFEPLTLLARKLVGEIRYHVMHADVLIKKLGTANPESITRLQESLDTIYPYALGIFEVSSYEKELIENGVYAGEKALKQQWLEKVESVIKQTELQLPDSKLVTPQLGGRYGKHTEHLQPLLEEMAEVFRTDPAAEW